MDNLVDSFVPKEFMGEIIAIVNQKGGTGKTTTSVNLSSALARQGKDVVVIDFDPQANLTYAFGIEENEGTIADVLREQNSLSDVLLEREGARVAPGDIALADVEVSLINEIGREFFLSEAIKGLKGYDYLIIDCPPSLSLLAINALVAADYSIVPMQMEVMSLQGLNQIRNTIERINRSYKLDIYIKGILAVMVDRRRNLDSEIEDFIQNNYEIPLFSSKIRTNVRASEAPSFGQSVISYAPRSNSAIDYMEFARELMNNEP